MAATARDQPRPILRRFGAISAAAAAAAPAVCRADTPTAYIGTTAMGRFGPNLSHLMSRRTLAAGTLPNTIGYLSGWIADPQHVKPGNYMPELDLSGPQLNAIRSFLETLSGFSKYFWPLFLGSRDMAFPRLNAFSYWVFLASGIFLSGCSRIPGSI